MMHGILLKKGNPVFLFGKINVSIFSLNHRTFYPQMALINMNCYLFYVRDRQKMNYVG